MLNNIPIDILAGCSAGSVVAGAYATGTMQNLKKRLLEGSRKDYFDVMFEPGIPKEGFLKGDRNKIFFEEFVGKKTFDQLDKKLIIAAKVDIVDKEYYEKQTGNHATRLNDGQALLFWGILEGGLVQ